MSTINRVVLLGNVGNVEVKDFESGRKLVQVSLATADGYKKDGKWEDKTEWHKCIFAIPALAERAALIQKGDKIYVEGSISTNAWTTKDGDKREYKEISCTIFKTFSRANKDGVKDFNQPKTSVSESLNSVADDMPF